MAALTMQQPRAQWSMHEHGVKLEWRCTLRLQHGMHGCLSVHMAWVLGRRTYVHRTLCDGLGHAHVIWQVCVPLLLACRETLLSLRALRAATKPCGLFERAA